MSAEEAVAWFAKLRGEAVSAEDRSRFEAWLQASPAHRRAYEEVAAFWDDPGFSQVLGEAESVPAVPAAGRRPARRTFRRRAKLAWALAAALAGFTVIQWPAGTVCPQGGFCTAVGELRTLALEDGSLVTLNTGTAIQVDSRHVRLLRGEAYFEVVPDAARLFTVDGHFSRTRVKGTRFVVREGQVADTVTVVSGVVEVGRDGKGSATLRENEQISVGADQALAVRKASASAAAAWIKGKAVFDNAPLSEVAAEIARYRRGTVWVKNDKLGALRVSGRFDIADTDRALESLAQTLPIRVFRITPWLVLIA